MIERKYILRMAVIAMIGWSIVFGGDNELLAKKPLQKRGEYEFTFDMPKYVEDLKKELTYPMAWGNSDEKDFESWRMMAREKVLECMMTPPKESFGRSGNCRYGAQGGI